MKGLIAYMILSSFAINILPGERYKKYVSLYSGLVTIILLLTPIMNVLKIDPAQIIIEAEKYISFNMNDDVSWYLNDKPTFDTLAQELCYDEGEEE